MEDNKFSIDGLMIASPEHLDEVLNYCYALKVDDKDSGKSFYPYVQEKWDKQESGYRLIDLINQHLVFIQIKSYSVYVRTIESIDFQANYHAFWGLAEDYLLNVETPKINEKVVIDLSAFNRVPELIYKILCKDMVKKHNLKYVEILSPGRDAVSFTRGDLDRINKTFQGEDKDEEDN